MQARHIYHTLILLLLSALLLAAAGCGKEIPRLTKDIPLIGDRAMWVKRAAPLLAEPQRAAPTIAQLNPGDEVAEQERNQFGWSKVTTSSGKVGWVASSRLSTSPVKATPAKAAAPAAPAKPDDEARQAEEAMPNQDQPLKPAREGKPGMFNSL